MSSILACGQTDPGLARLHNEDAFRVDGDNGLYVVADGMGGHSHGEVASKIAVETIARTLRAPEPVRSHADSAAAPGRQLESGDAAAPQSVGGDPGPAPVCAPTA